MDAFAWENTEVLWNACILSVCKLSLFPVVHVDMGRGMHGRDLLQLREEVAGLMHVLAHVDATEHRLIRMSGLFSFLPPVTEPQALQAASQHGDTFAECKHQVTHTRTLNPAW